MAQNLYIHSLTLKGYRKDYSINFKRGLNFITGPIATGKSSILELINYALGSKVHKDYQEVKSSCTDVELVIEIKAIKYKIVRPLFYFDRPFKLYTWNELFNDFTDEFEIFEVSSPRNNNSLSNFLLDKLDVPEITISNQAFSFRDLFKYCYVNQSHIDSENLLNEKNYQSNFKRKPTLEIILNSLNQILHHLKELKKQKKEAINEYHVRKNAIVDFLTSVELNITTESIIVEKNRLTERKLAISTELNDIKQTSKVKDDFTKSLEAQLFLYDREIKSFKTNHQEILDYKNKLNLLRNQYSKESVKYDYLLMAQGKIQSLEFEECPSCNSELKISEYGKCSLCGSDLTELEPEEVKALTLEKKRLNSKINELIDFIELQNNELNQISKEIETIVKKRAKSEEKLNTVQQVYISPLISKIEELNRELGEVDNQIENIDSSNKVQLELAEISREIRIAELRYEDLVKQIKDLEEENVNFDLILLQLSKTFSSVLKEFDFPKLTDACIEGKTYLPFVRNVKYDNIGSGGAVTLITIAYFVSILRTCLQLQKTYHPGVLMLDTIGKNLGAVENNSEKDEFRDHKIFRLMMKYLSDFAQKNEDSIQLILINNHYTDDIRDEDIIVKFDGDGSHGIKYGLIDDMI
ncbi:MAG: hypothetical protein JXR82_13580 [Marinifilaceae bacterium]|nr:hypothetical protein [Marinifilaceae bacterium]